MTSKINAQDRKDFDKFTKVFIYKAIQIIVQSRLGEKTISKSKVATCGIDWFNMAITGNNEVQAESKKVLSNQSSTLAQTVCIEISLRTAELESMVLELWYISLDMNQCDNSIIISQSGYYRMGLALKSLLSITRVTPAYKLSRRQGSSDFVICYRLYLGEPHFLSLGEDSQKSKVGCVPTPYGTITINLSYRTNLHISPQNTFKEIPFEVNDDHFKLDGGPKPCVLGYRRSSTNEFETGGGQCEESSTTTFSTSPIDAPKVVGTTSHQSQPIKIKKGTSAISDQFPDFRTQSTPEKQTAIFQDYGCVPPFADSSLYQEKYDDYVPFQCLLDLANKKKVAKSKVLEPVKQVAKADYNKGDTGEPKTSTSNSESKLSEPKTSTSNSESNLSEPKTNTSSKMSADNLLFTKLNLPFAGDDDNSLSRFCADCLQPPKLEEAGDEVHNVAETLDQIDTQLTMFEAKMEDFDSFVSEVESVNIGGEN